MLKKAVFNGIILSTDLLKENKMNFVLYEGIAFGITLISTLYGIFTILKTNAPFYFKMIVNAVGCYTLEELWVIVNSICGVEVDIRLSIRLIGIFACFCAFLSANLKCFEEIVKTGSKKVVANKIGFVAPILLFLLFFIYEFLVFKKSFSYIIIPFIVIIPAIVDSYYELKHLFLANDDFGLMKYIRPISAFVLIEYAITFAYLYIESINIKMILDIASALVMATLIILTKKGANKWKTLT